MAPRLCNPIVALLVAAGSAALSAPMVRADEAVPRRIVSLNLCTDALLLDLVPRERIAALSHLAADPLVSPVAERAKDIPWTRGEAERVLAFDPDLVLAGTFTTPATLDLLERISRRVERVPLASDIDGIRAAVLQVAGSVGERAKGAELVRRLDETLAAAAADAPKGRRPSAAVYQVNGLSSGPGSLADALMTAAGLANHTAALGLGASGALPLELLAARPPDLVVLSGPADEYRTVVAENLRHPALAAVLAGRASAVVPWRLWLCGTHHAGEAVSLLARARRRIGGDAPRTPK
ncbi:MAG: ABC transporter substrate-binding protein [Hyphomicrobiaceae bacterium]